MRSVSGVADGFGFGASLFAAPLTSSWTENAVASQFEQALGLRTTGFTTEPKAP